MLFLPQSSTLFQFANPIIIERYSNVGMRRCFWTLIQRIFPLGLFF